MSADNDQARTLHLTIGDMQLVVDVGDETFVAPVGLADLAGEISGDPPSPEGLTNVIGLVSDHLDDALRIVASVAAADTLAILGPAVQTWSDVELGGVSVLPRPITRDDAEDLFRMLATERRAQRASNPGLVAAHIDSIIVVSCVIVAAMRKLQFDEATLADAVEKP